jgi:hypothetical protein
MILNIDKVKEFIFYSPHHKTLKAKRIEVIIQAQFRQAMQNFSC